jgi:hypothetical protein
MADQKAGGPPPIGEATVQIPNPVQAVLSGQVPKFYGNGIALQATASDITLICLDGPLPVVAITLAYSTAKSLAHDLGLGIQNYEEKTGEKIMMVKDLTALLTREKK